jgi:hypothetical protein
MIVVGQTAAVCSTAAEGQRQQQQPRHGPFARGLFTAATSKEAQRAAVMQHVGCPPPGALMQPLMLSTVSECTALSLSTSPASLAGQSAAITGVHAGVVGVAAAVALLQCSPLQLPPDGGESATAARLTSQLVGALTTAAQPQPSRAAAQALLDGIAQREVEALLAAVMAADGDSDADGEEGEEGREVRP